MTVSWKSVLLGVLAAIVLTLLVALIVVLSGGYNVAATERHLSIGEWALDTNFTNSVQGQAEEIDAPAFSKAMIDAGAPEYKAMCAHCHGGVGESRAQWAEGMRPKPPALAAAADEWKPAEVFWLVRNGAKMTGMPAFGPTHDDRTIWNIAAFVKALPEMSAAQYAAYPSAHGSGGAAGNHDHASGAAPHEE